jgi:erythromycin esterase-like protein
MILSLMDRIRSTARPLPAITDEFLGHHFDWLSKYNVMLLGDCTHGTSEFYQARAEITKHLIRNHGFNILALEGDWLDAEVVDRYIRQRPSL